MPGCIDGFELEHFVAERWPEIEIVVASEHRRPRPECAARRASGYTLAAGYHLPPLNLTAKEAEALALGARVLAT